MSENVWKHFCFGSGTQIVQFVGDAEMPYYYVHAGKNGMPYEHYRSQVCEDLCAYLNDGVVATWMGQLMRKADYPDTVCTGPNGIKIHATGPSRLPENDDGRMLWEQQERDDGQRAALINKLVSVAEQASS